MSAHQAAMLIAHLPAGYILGTVAQHHISSRNKAFMAAALIGSFAPDFDMLHFHLIDGRRTPHHEYITHWPLFWLVAGAVLIWLAKLRDFSVTVPVVFLVGVFMHLIMDSVAAPIHWLMPFSKGTIELVSVPRISPNWIVSFMLHWTFVAEIAICVVAALIFAGRRLHTREVNAPEQLQSEFPENTA